jgi:hypothetical protein
MCKKSFVTMKCNRKNYRIYLPDILRVHTIIKKIIPPPPLYIEHLSPKSFEK